jgi:hypothetical protein
MGLAAIVKMSSETTPSQPAVTAEDCKEAQLSPDPNPTTEQRDFSVFTVGQKRAIVATGSLAAFFSPLSSSIYFPALETISHELGVSISKINLTVTTYLVSSSLCILPAPALIKFHLADSTRLRAHADRWLLG